MGAAKESPAVQMLEWAVGKLDEASKVDWVEKLSTLTASKPAYLRNGLVGSAPAPAPAPAGGGVAQADLDAAVARATRAEARVETLAQRVAQLERQLAAGNPPEAGTEAETGGDGHVDEHPKPHWWSRH
jgi:hypothetical protein